MRTSIVGLFVGLILGLITALAGFYGLLVTAVGGALGYLVGAQLGGTLDLRQVLDRSNG